MSGDNGTNLTQAWRTLKWTWSPVCWGVNHCYADLKEGCLKLRHLEPVSGCRVQLGCRISTFRARPLLFEKGSFKWLRYASKAMASSVGNFIHTQPKKSNTFKDRVQVCGSYLELILCTHG